LISGDRRPPGFSSEGAAEGDRPVRDQLMRRLREEFRPEFLNRIDGVIVFRRLESEQLRQITDLLLDDTRRRLHAQEINAVFAPEAVDWLAEQGFQPEFGARPLRRTIEREVEDQLSNMLLEGDLQPGQRVE